MKKIVLSLLLFSCTVLAREVRVFLVDTGVDANHLDLVRYIVPGTYDDTHDDYGHGTHVAGIIAQSNCPNLKIISCKAFFHGHGEYNRLQDCFKRALTENIDILNFSGGGEGARTEEYNVLKQLSDKGVKINVAAGNDARNLGSPCWGFFPACYENIENMTVVGALTMHGEHLFNSNYGYPGMKWEQGEGIFSSLPGNKQGSMTGTSQATAMYTQYLVREMCYQGKK